MASTSPVPVGYRYYRAQIEEAANAFVVDPVVLAAICWQESGFNADAFRFEPDFYNRYLKRLPAWAGSNPRRVSSSYGLTQVMFVSATEDGTIAITDPPEILFQPQRALVAGATRLARLTKWADALPLSADERQVAAIAAYNGGKGGNDKPPFRNVKYAREVQSKIGLLRKELANAKP